MTDFDEILSAYLQKKTSLEVFFQAFEKKYRQMILAFLLSLTPDQSQVEDVYQELLLSIHQKLHTHYKEGNFKAWVFRMARNITMNYLHSAGGKSITQKEIPVDTRAPGPGPKTENIQKEIRSLVVQALDGLPAKYRELIFLKFNSDLSYKEISSITGLPITTIQTRITKGMQLLYGVINSLNPNE